MLKLLQVLFILQSGISGFYVDKNRIYDDLGRERIFHGANVVVKQFPCHPTIDQFNYNKSFNQEDRDIFMENGLNFIRLGVMWSCVEPKRGEYNLTYLSIMKELVTNVEKSNISVLIEFHQDAFL